ncbi:hypothetical protein FJY63_09650 [Candidatus Sumerlaeota bacterium]|nr:hypothetical protein [Candidatus Sumerlaeota bacterium]
MEAVTKETTDISFIWKTVSPNEDLKISVFSTGDNLAGRPSPRRSILGRADGSPVIFFGVGVRRHFPYIVDVGAPFDDLALGRGWQRAERDGQVTYRWTEARAFLTFHLPEPGVSASNWELALRVARRIRASSDSGKAGGAAESSPETPQSVKIEVLWDGRKLTGSAPGVRQTSPQVGAEWTTVRLPLPAPPAKGSHEVEITSPIFYAPDPADRTRQIRCGIMVDNVAIESSAPLFSVPP